MIPPSITTILHGAKQDPPYWFILLTMSWIPAQGIFNSIVYFHPKLTKKKKGSDTVATERRPGSSLDMPNNSNGNASAEITMADGSTSKRHGTANNLQSTVEEDEGEEESKREESPGNGETPPAQQS